MSTTENQLLRPYSTDISDNLQHLLSLHSMNILELSNRIGVSYSAVYRLVHHPSNPNLETLLKVCKAFNLKVSQLIGEFPILKDAHLSSITAIPMLGWDEVLGFLDTGKEAKTNNTLLLTTCAAITARCFAVFATKKNEPTFKSETTLIFDVLSGKVEEYDNKFVLISNNGSMPVLKKLCVEGGKIFLQSLNKTIPTYELLPTDSVIAYLFQAKMDF